MQNGRTVAVTAIVATLVAAAARSLEPGAMSKAAPTPTVTKTLLNFHLMIFITA
jgi:hypothetical protein